MVCSLLSNHDCEAAHIYIKYFADGENPQFHLNREIVLGLGVGQAECDWTH
jgi:hypothetical protein